MKHLYENTRDLTEPVFADSGRRNRSNKKDTKLIKHFTNKLNARNGRKENWSMLTQEQIKRIKATYDFEQSIKQTNQSLEDVLDLHSRNIDTEGEIVWYEELINDFKKYVKQYKIPKEQEPDLYEKLYKIRMQGLTVDEYLKLNNIKHSKSGNDYCNYNILNIKEVPNYISKMQSYINNKYNMTFPKVNKDDVPVKFGITNVDSYNLCIILNRIMNLTARRIRNSNKEFKLLFEINGKLCEIANDEKNIKKKIDSILYLKFTLRELTLINKLLQKELKYKTMILKPQNEYLNILSDITLMINDILMNYGGSKLLISKDFKRTPILKYLEPYHPKNRQEWYY